MRFSPRSGLRDEVRDGAAVVQPHPRPVGIEDTDDLGVQPVVAVVGGGYRLGEALGFVVDAARTDGVDVAPVGLPLGMLQRVAVDLRRRGEHEARTLGLGQPQRVVRAQRADLQGWNRKLQVVDGARRARPVQDQIHRARDRNLIGDVVVDELEVAVPQMADVREASGQQVVDPDHGVPAIEQAVGEMRADEAGDAGNDGTRHQPVANAPLHSSGAASRVDGVAPRSSMANMLPRRDGNGLYLHVEPSGARRARRSWSSGAPRGDSVSKRVAREGPGAPAAE